MLYPWIRKIKPRSCSSVFIGFSKRKEWSLNACPDNNKAGISFGMKALVDASTIVKTPA
jgi:hypothetical protein